MNLLPADVAAIKDAKTAEELLLSRFDTPRIRKACAIAAEYHEGQFRKSGEAYVVHPLLVATFVASLGSDESMVIAAVLHDTVEDTPFTLQKTYDFFGQDVASIVDGLTKIDQIREENLIPSNIVDEKLIQSALTFRKMLVASIQDVRVLVIKLCDRLHNILTLDALKEAKQKRIAEETLVVYAPIAHRLGIGWIKNILEDRSFYYIFREDYQKISLYLKGNEQNMRLGLNQLISEIKEKFLLAGFAEEDFEVRSRIKHYYSIYAKMQRKGVGIDEVMDLLAIRILVKTPQDCYKVLGMLHTSYKPLVARFKDYIALPKENGYQTLHTTLFHEMGIYEVQIRTFDMHKTAEYGIAAHWKYKANTTSPKLAWLESMQYSSENPLDFYELAKNDLFSEEIVVYSPQAETFTLPIGSTALDFAFAVHSQVGLRAVSAHINSVKKPLLQILKTGDMIEIETGDEIVPRCSWIDSLKTSRAKNILKQECNNRTRELDRLSAMSMLSLYLNVPQKALSPWLKVRGYEDVLHKVVREDNKLLEEIMTRYKKEKAKRGLFSLDFSTHKFHKIDNLEVFANKPVTEVLFDHCCHPKFGDAILLFYHKRQKAIIHHKLCENAYRQLRDGGYVYKANWTGSKVGLYRLVINLENKKGALLSLVSYLARHNVNIATVSLGQANHGLPSWCEIVAELQLSSLQKIEIGIRKRFKLVEFALQDDKYKKE